MLTSPVAERPRSLLGAGGPAFPPSRAAGTSYNASRLGLAPPVRDVRQSSQSEGRAEYVKKTFRMPRELHGRLRAYALATHQFQYALICEAVLSLLRQTMAPEDGVPEAGASQSADHPEDASSSQAPARMDQPRVLTAWRNRLTPILLPLRAVRAMLLRLRPWRPARSGR